MVIRKRIILLLFLLTIYINPVHAIDDYDTSGIVEFYAVDSKGYTLIQSSPHQNLNPLWIQHRFTDAKIIDFIQSLDMYSYSGDPYSATSSFTSIVDGVYYGSGIASINNVGGDSLYRVSFSSYNNDYLKTITGQKRIVLDIDDMSIFNGVSKTNGESLTALTANIPSGFELSVGNTYCASGVYLMSFQSYYSNSYEYNYNYSLNMFHLDVDKGGYQSHIIAKNSVGVIYVEDSVYTTTNFSIYDTYNNGVILAVKFDFDGGTYVNTSIHGLPSGDDDFEYVITTELDEYSPGDTVNVTYTTDQKGMIQVVKTISDDIYHSIGFVSGATNATWKFYIAENEPYGFYDVHLLDSSNTILDTVRYALLPSTSSLEILQSSVDLHETFVVFAQTVNESILSIENPDGVEVWNETIDALMYDYIYYTPTIKTGIYTAYLYDDTTLTDTVMVYLADPPIIDDPLDPETNGSIVVEDVLDDDESMTSYFDDKFREFAPTAWGIFMLSIVLWLMSIISSFGGSKRR